MMRSDAPFRLVAIAVIGAASAGAFAVAPLGEAASYVNAFVFGDLTYSSNDTDGPLAVGGTLRVNGSFQVNSAELGSAFGVPTMSNVGLLVRGGLVAPPNAGDLKVKGNAYVAGAISGGAIQYQSGSLFTGSAVDVGIFDRQRAFSLGQTAAIRAMVSQGTITGSGNSFNVDLSSVPSTLFDGQIVKRISVAASVIGANPLATLNLANAPSGATVLVDVLGSGSLDWNWSVNGIAAERLLWNAKDLTSVRVGDRDFTGSLLAPTAAVTIVNGNFDGNLIADSLIVNNAKELHWGSGIRFNGTAPVPEPASLAVLALGAAGLLRRRRV